MYSCLECIEDNYEFVMQSEVMIWKLLPIVSIPFDFSTISKRQLEFIGLDEKQKKKLESVFYNVFFFFLLFSIVIIFKNARQITSVN